MLNKNAGGNLFLCVGKFPQCIQTGLTKCYANYGVNMQGPLIKVEK